MASIRAAVGGLPLKVAARGPGAIAVAALHGDAWVSFGGFDVESGVVFLRTRRRIELLEHLAGARPIRRRLLCGSAALTHEPIWQPVDAFEDFVGRYRSLGIDEFAFHWPPQDTNPAAGAAALD